VVGSLLQTAGAFYIRRGLGVPDPVLTDKVTDLVRQGHWLAFYPEGKRSRSRRFLQPKRGILRALQQAGRPVMVFPLSISYDRVAEECGFQFELDGRGRPRTGLVPILQWVGRMLRGKIDLGRVHIRCGAPQRLDADSDAHALSLRMMAELQRHSAVSTFHLRTFCRHHRGPAIDPEALRAAIIERGGVVVESRLHEACEIPAAVRRTFECQWMHLFYADALARMPGDMAVQSHVRRNGFWYPQTARDDPLTRVVVEALFAPIRRDYERVLRVATAMPVGAELDVAPLLRQMPGAFLRDVEDSLAELADRGMLCAEAGVFRRVHSSPGTAARQALP
jgi:alcohol-forming fatty acyl-CoA reductase